MMLPVRCMHSDPLRVYYGHPRKEAAPMDKPQANKPLFTPPKVKKKRMGKSPVQH